eukprot:scaffold1541_cov256-Pinguiococcus_pyrenoidosus.AAC.44
MSQSLEIGACGTTAIETLALHLVGCAFRSGDLRLKRHEVVVDRPAADAVRWICRQQVYLTFHAVLRGGERHFPRIPRDLRRRGLAGKSKGVEFRKNMKIIHRRL